MAAGSPVAVAAGVLSTREIWPQPTGARIDYSAIWFKDPAVRPVTSPINLQIAEGLGCRCPEKNRWFALENRSVLSTQKNHRSHFQVAKLFTKSNCIPSVACTTPPKLVRFPAFLLFPTTKQTVNKPTNKKVPWCLFLSAFTSSTLSSRLCHILCGTVKNQIRMNIIIKQ